MCITVIAINTESDSSLPGVVVDWLVQTLVRIQSQRCQSSFLLHCARHQNGVPMRKSSHTHSCLRWMNRLLEA